MSLSSRIEARRAAKRGEPVVETAPPKVAEKVAEKPKKKKGFFGRKK